MNLTFGGSSLARSAVNRFSSTVNGTLVTPVSEPPSSPIASHENASVPPTISAVPSSSSSESTSVTGSKLAPAAIAGQSTAIAGQLRQALAVKSRQRRSSPPSVAASPASPASATGIGGHWSPASKLSGG